MNTLHEFVAILSSPSHFLPSCTPDFRTAQVRRLAPHIHASHIVEKYERRSSRFGSRRKFATKTVGEATMLPDKQFNQLVAALAAIKKLTT
jgi:hypothetical protein